MCSRHSLVNLHVIKVKEICSLESPRRGHDLMLPSRGIDKILPCERPGVSKLKGTTEKLGRKTKILNGCGRADFCA